MELKQNYEIVILPNQIIPVVGNVDFTKVCS